jgi:hypothetical protein
MPIIGATQLEPVNVVSNYLAGQEMRRNALLQQQEAMRAQQRMELEQRRFQREEDAAAAEAQNALLRRQALATGDPRAMFARGFTKEAADYASLTKTQEDREYETRKRGLEELAQQASAFARNPTMLTPENVDPWAQDALASNRISPQAYEQLRATYGDPRAMQGFFTQLRDQGLTVAQQLENDRAARTAAIQEGQLRISAGNLALSQRQQSLAERKFDEEVRQFGIKNQQELEKLQRESPEFLAKIEQMKAAGKYEGERLTKARMDLPDALAKADEAVRLIDEMVGKEGAKGAEGRPHPGFRGAVGAGFGTRFIPGTPAASFQSRYEQVTGSAFLQAYETLKGTGQITEIEGAKATAAITRMQLSASEKEFVEAAREFQRVIRAAAKRRAEAAGAAAPAPGSATRQTASGTSYTIEE